MLSRVSHAWQSWRSAKTVAILATIALSIGIGSTTAIYTVVDAVLLKPLPYAHSERLVALFAADTTNPADRNGLNYTDLLQYQQRVRSFEALGWFVYAADTVNLMFRGHPDNVKCLSVTPSILNSLGVRLTLGQWFHDPAHDPGGYNVAVISHPLWSRLGSDPAIVGKTLALAGRQVTIVGVAPPGFRFPLTAAERRVEENDLWVPLDPRNEAQEASSGIYIAYARLRPGVTLNSAEAEVKSIAAQIAKADPAAHPSYTARIFSLRDSAVLEIRPVLLLLFAAAGLLFLITCANVAGLLLARSISRARETAVRVAVGATASQLAGQYFLEGLLLSLAGAAFGMLISFVLVRLVLAIAGDYDVFANQTSLNARVFLFVFGVAFLASALFSSAPLWQALRSSPNSILSGGVRFSAGKPTRRLSQSLVVGEIALAFTLLAVSSLLLTQLSSLYRLSPGFASGGLMTFQLHADESKYSDNAKLATYQRRLIQTLEAVPGVHGAAFTNELPLAGCCYDTSVYPDGSSIRANEAPSINLHGVSPNYFSVLRIPLVAGRFLRERDTSEIIVPAVIDQAALRRYWPHQNPVGTYGHLRGRSGPRFEVIGVVGSIHNKGLNEMEFPEIYFVNGLLPANPMHFLVRSSVAPNALVPALRRAVMAVDPAQPIYDVRPMSEVIQSSLTVQRLSSLMVTIFAVIAVLMAALGVYGVVSYSVRQRTVEIGTRMALGAQNRDLFGLVLGDGFRLAAYGLIIGAAAITAAVWLLLNVLRLVQQLDTRSFLYALLLIAAIVFAASFFPAWRAILLSPMVAIRAESISGWQSAWRGLLQFARGVTAPVSRLAASPAAFGDVTLLSDFVQATRSATTFEEALRLALTTLRAKLAVASALLYENVSGAEYQRIAGVPSEAAAPSSLPAPGFLSTRLGFYSLPLPISPGDLSTWLRWAAENKPHYLSELEALAQTQAHLAVPLRTKTEMLGILLLGAPADRPAYTASDLRLLRTCAEQFALMLENARLTGRVVEQEKLRRDVALAVEVQKRLLPAASPQSPAASLAALSIPARSVGGDYYDFFQVGDQRIGIALADIAGKGIAAALIMSVVQASLRIISAEENVSLPQLASRLNRYLYRSTGSNGYATFFYAQLDERTRQLRYVNAGHNPPYLLRSENGGFAGANGYASAPFSAAHVEELSTGGIVIGMFPQASYEEAAIDLKSGDVLVAFTDGVTEAMSPGEEEFGEERLKDLLRQVAHLSVDEISSRISGELRTWISHADQHDDLTFVVMKVN